MSAVAIASNGVTFGSDDQSRKVRHPRRPLGAVFSSVWSPYIIGLVLIRTLENNATFGYV